MPARYARLLLAACLSLSLATPRALGDDDRYGDPLPERAIARIGTVRFRHGSIIYAVAYSQNGRLIASGGREKVRLWESESGRELRSFEAEFGHWIDSVSFSPDGKLLAGGTLNGYAYVWDTATGRQICRLGPKVGTWGRVAFAPDGRLLAFAGKGLSLYDVATWRERTLSVELPEGVLSMAFTPDGGQLVLGRDSDSVIRLWSLKSDKQVGGFEGPAGGLAHALAISPDGTKLAIGGRDDVALWELRTGRSLWRVGVPELPDGSRPPVRQVQFSQDGKAIVTAAYGQLILWDVATGKKRLQWAEPTLGVAFSPSGRTLAAAAEHAIRLWDTSSGREVLATSEARDGVSAVAFSRDGRLFAAGDGGGIRLYDRRTLKEIRHLTGNRSPITRIHFAPDGRTLASEEQHNVVRLWEVSEGRALRAWGDGSSRLSRVSPDLRTVVTWQPRERGDLEVWDAKTGQPLQRFPLQIQDLSGMAFSPDSRWLAFGRPWQIMDPRTGRRSCTIEDEDASTTGVAFSADGRSAIRLFFLRDAGQVYEVATGRQRCSLTERIGFAQVAMSPGKPMFLTWVWRSSSGVLWDLYGGRQLSQLDGHRGAIRGAAFSPDGTILATASDDSTVLFWDMKAVVKAGQPPAADPTRQELDAIWSDLAGSDARRAYQGICKLIQSPGPSVAFLSERLKPVPPADPQRVVRLTADLDSEAFAVREKATKELEQLGELAEPALRKLLAGKPTLEVRQRAEALLDKLESPASSPERLRQVRAVEALEHMGTSEARKLLETLATGVAEALLTKEARASVERLKRLPAAKD